MTRDKKPKDEIIIKKMIHKNYFFLHYYGRRQEHKNSVEKCRRKRSFVSLNLYANADMIEL